MSKLSIYISITLRFVLGLSLSQAATKVGGMYGGACVGSLQLFGPGSGGVHYSLSLSIGQHSTTWCCTNSRTIPVSLVTWNLFCLHS